MEYAIPGGLDIATLSAHASFAEWQSLLLGIHYAFEDLRPVDDDLDELGDYKLRWPADLWQLGAAALDAGQQLRPQSDDNGWKQPCDQHHGDHRSGSGHAQLGDG